MIYAAYYNPETGVIIQCSSADRASIAANPWPYVELPEQAPIGFDLHHRVVDGAVVPIATTPNGNT